MRSLAIAIVATLILGAVLACGPSSAQQTPSPCAQNPVYCP